MCFCDIFVIVFLKHMSNFGNSNTRGFHHFHPWFHHFSKRTWMRYYSPDQRHHLLHYVLAERYDYKEFLWREMRCTEYFRQWIKSMSDKIGVKLTWGGMEMLQALFVFRRCWNTLPEGAVRSPPDTSLLLFDDSPSTSKDVHFLAPFPRLNVLTQESQWLSRNLPFCFNSHIWVIKWKLGSVSVHPYGQLWP